MAIAGVQVASWKYAYAGLVPDALLDAFTVSVRTARWEQILAVRRPQERTLVAVMEDQVVGFCSLGPSRDADAAGSTGEVYALYVRPGMMGMGVGSGLLREACDTLREKAYRTATLWVLTNNERGRGFYQHQGWASDETTQIDGRGLHETRYSIRLDQL